MNASRCCWIANIRSATPTFSNVTDLKSLIRQVSKQDFPLSCRNTSTTTGPRSAEVLGGAGFVAKRNLDYTAQLRESDRVYEDRVVYERLPNDNPKWFAPDEYKKIYSDGNSESS